LAATLEVESTLTDRYQTTVPETDRLALRLGKRDKIHCTVTIRRPTSTPCMVITRSRSTSLPEMSIAASPSALSHTFRSGVRFTAKSC
jgi:bifunctional DNA-binding transcriptional regulator/antitoxin component of YhaV-PrlF toxin-antitoxin module